MGKLLNFLIVAALYLHTSHAMAWLVRPVVLFGFDAGGDNLDSIVEGPEFKIHAGSGLLLDGGAVILMSNTNPHSFETRLTIGVRYSENGGDGNDLISFTRYPLTLMSFYHNTVHSIRLGFGPTYLLHGSLRGEGKHAVSTTDFSSRFGFAVAGEFYWNQPRKQETQRESADETSETPTQPTDVGFGVRFTWLDYETAQSRRTISGNALGIYIWSLF